MGLFGPAPPCDTEVERATDEKNVGEDWALIMEICDKAGKAPAAKDYMRAILKRMNHSDPHVAIQAVTLLDACIKNCGATFHVEIASREFENEYMKLLKKSHAQVKRKLNDSLKKWAENEFKSDPQLNLIPSLYTKLRHNGVDFHETDEEMMAKKAITLSKDPNVVQSQDEADQIAKAIELSLKDTSAAAAASATTSAAAAPDNVAAAAGSLYPSTNIGAMPALREQVKVRALYDFEAAEDNELTFSAGEILFIIDDSDPNWWKGTNQRGEGLFPANFVTTDLSVDPDQLVDENKKKSDDLDESLDKRLDEMKEVSEIDEGKIDQLLHLLHEADPTNADYDTKEMVGMERDVNSMGTLIDKELERVDRKHAQLTQLSADLVEALSLYHSLMREPQFPSMPPAGAMKPPHYAPFPMAPPGTSGGGPIPQPPPPPMMYNGALPPPTQSPMVYNTLDRQFMPPQNQMPPNQFHTPMPLNMIQQRPPHMAQQQFAPVGQMTHTMPGLSGPPHVQQMGQSGPRPYPPQVPLNARFPGAPPPPQPPPNQNSSFTQMPPPASNTM